MSVIRDIAVSVSVLTRDTAASVSVIKNTTENGCINRL